MLGPVREVRRELDVRDTRVGRLCLTLAHADRAGRVGGVAAAEDQRALVRFVVLVVLDAARTLLDVCSMSARCLLDVPRYDFSWQSARGHGAPRSD